MNTPPPTTPDEPSNRWPWVALVLGLLVVAVAVVLFFVNRGNTVNINLEGTPTPNPVARASTASPGPPPTLVPPTLPASATLAPSPTPVPTSPTAAPTQPPPTVPPPPPTQAAAPATAQQQRLPHSPPLPQPRRLLQPARRHSRARLPTRVAWAIPTQISTRHTVRRPARHPITWSSIGRTISSTTSRLRPTRIRGRGWW